MLIFAENPDYFIDSFSSKLHDDLVYILSHRYTTRKINPQQLYNEYLREGRHNIHLNATKWSDINDLFSQLEEEGHIEVFYSDESDSSSVLVQYKSTDLEKQKVRESAKKRKLELDEESRREQFFTNQIQKAQETNSAKSTQQQLRELDKSQKTTIKLSLEGSILNNSLKTFATDDDESVDYQLSKQRTKNTINFNDRWIRKDLIVKIVDSNSKYYKQKALIKAVQDFTAKVELIDNGDINEIYQDQLETVIPALGSKVIIVSGINKHLKAQLLDIIPENYKGKLRLDSGEILYLPYENFCKFSESIQ